jgi:hypothetical protein
MQPLDGPSLQGKLTGVGTVTPVEIFVTGQAFEDRKVVTMQGDGRFYLYFGDMDTGAPSAVNVSDNGQIVFKNQLITIEATCDQPLYVLAVAGTVDIRIAERA